MGCARRKGHASNFLPITAQQRWPMTKWSPVFVLPNIEIGEPIDGEIAILAPAHDRRVVDLAQAHPNFKAFLGNFSDAFGVRLAPTIVLVRADSPKSFYTVDALASFRDLIALSVIAYNRALELKYPRGHRVLFGNAFSFYPWMIDKDYEYLIGRTPAILGLHEVSKFRGQCSPELFRMDLRSSAIDEPLLRELLMRWRRRYAVAAPAWPDIALFRSLNMGYHASLLPAASDTTFYDVGRLLSLWVSAFEILVHPGGDGVANRDKVFDLLEGVCWGLSGCSEKRFETGGKKKINRTLGSWLYQALYDRRNDFLHGNPVAHADLQFSGSGRNLFEYAAPLYRLALTGFLPLVFTRTMPSRGDAEAVGSYIAEHSAFSRPQRMFEEALLTADAASQGHQVRHSRGIDG
jgi:hypothetical protein